MKRTDKKKLVLAKQDLQALTLSTDQLQQIAGASGYLGCARPSSPCQTER